MTNCRFALVALCVVRASTMPVFAQSAAVPNAGADAYFSEPAIVSNAIERFDKLTEKTDGAEPRDGFYPELGGMITGSGWLSAGPGYRHTIAGGKGRVSASAGLSVRFYTMAQARIEFPDIVRGFTLGAQTLYRDSLQVNYFGLGNGSLEQDRSGYRVQTTQVAAFASRRHGALDISARAGWLPQVRVSNMRGRIPKYPDTVAHFDDAAAPGVADSTSFAFADASVALDTRVTAKYPVRGGRYEVRWAGYADRDRGRYSFQRYEAQASHFVPLTPRWGLAGEAWVVGTAAGDGQVVPFYLLPSLGGKNTLRGFADYRFHDRAMELVSVESRWALWRHLEVAAFADAGRVAPRFGDLGFRDLNPSVGVGVRLHNSQAPITRLDVAKSREGWHLVFKWTQPFTRSAPDSGRLSALPFVP